MEQSAERQDAVFYLAFYLWFYTYNLDTEHNTTNNNYLEMIYRDS